jgi:Ca-activated chloride channel family protein
MIEFAWPWAFALLPLPLLAWWLLPPYRERQVSVQIPFFADVVKATGQTPHQGAVILRRSALQVIGASLIWVLLVIAAAHPELVGDPVIRDISTRDLMLAVDISGSMEQQDFRLPDNTMVERLAGVKRIIKDFIARRRSDRIGLIVFGTKAYIQTPFTQDLQTAAELVDDLNVGMAGEQTVIGDAIGIAIKAFDASTSQQKLLILLTDGNDTGSRVPPVHAADIAKQRGVTIYTVGIGNPHASGDNKVDLETLKTMASATGGHFFQAENGAKLETIYADIDRLAPVKIQSYSWRPRTPVFQWPLGVSVIVMLLRWSVLLMRRAWISRESSSHA